METYCNCTNQITELDIVQSERLRTPTMCAECRAVFWEFHEAESGVEK